MNGTGQATARSYPRRLQSGRQGGDHRRVGDRKAKLFPFPICVVASSMDEAYRHFAPSYAGMGIPVFPIKDKVPLVKNWLRMGCPAALSLAKNPRFSSAGIGMCCGRKSGITIVDVDEPGDGPLQAALARFGDTPLMVRTHSGKHHLYYRFAGERRQLHLDGMKLDILGDGGFAVLPPSVGPQGRYQFMRGSSDSLRNIELLPTIKSSAWAQPQQPADGKRPASAPPPATAEHGRDVGRRDRTLYRACLTAAATAETLADLEKFALAENAKFDPPLEIERALQKARQAWKYKLRGTLMLPGR